MLERVPPITWLTAGRPVPDPLPDSLLEAHLWANSFYPQTFTGINIAVGAAASTAVIEGEMSWSQLTTGRATPEQVDRLLERTKAMHRAFGIPCKFDPDYTETDATYAQSDGQRHYVCERIRSFTMYGDLPIRQSNAEYVSRIMPISLLDRVLMRSRGQEFFDDDQLYAPDIHGQPRPEALALHGLWSAAADSLKLKAAKDVSVFYRPLLVAPPEGGLNESDITSRTRAIERSMTELYGIIWAHTKGQLPEIADTTGVVIGRRLAYDFLRDLFRPISLPLWLRT